MAFLNAQVTPQKANELQRMTDNYSLYNKLKQEIDTDILTYNALRFAPTDVNLMRHMNDLKTKIETKKSSLQYLQNGIKSSLEVLNKSRIERQTMYDTAKTQREMAVQNIQRFVSGRVPRKVNEAFQTMDSFTKERTQEAERIDNNIQEYYSQKEDAYYYDDDIRRLILFLFDHIDALNTLKGGKLRLPTKKNYNIDNNMVQELRPLLDIQPTFFDVAGVDETIDVFQNIIEDAYSASQDIAEAIQYNLQQRLPPLRVDRPLDLTVNEVTKIALRNSNP
jgi:hypothetical protein